MRLFTQLAYKLWGLSDAGEIKRFFYLAMGAFCLLGSFSPLKPLKESLFINMVGPEYFSDVKKLSVVLMLLLVLFYSRLVDCFPKQRLIYAFLTFYAVVGLVFVVLLNHPTIGLANPTVSVNRWVAWGFYLFVESYITTMISLFWSFVNDVTSSSAAKRGYGMIMSGSQTGALILALLANVMIADVAHYNIRVLQLVLLSLLLFVLLGVIVWRLTAFLPQKAVANVQKTQERSWGLSSVLEGLKVVLTRPYVFGIFSLMLFQEIIMSLMSYEQAYLAKQTFALDSLVTKYYFDMNLFLQLLSCVFALFGTSIIHRAIGTRASLMSFPLLLVFSGIAYMYWPNLYAVTVFLVLLKGLHYAFNQPVRETLYIPTSTDIKYKAKAWIDVVGLRGSKWFGFELAKLLGHSSGAVGGVTLGLLSLWALMAGFVGSTNERAVDARTTIK